MQVERVDEICMYTKSVGHGLSGFGDFNTFCSSLKSAKFPFRTMDYIVHGGQKIELAQKFFMQVEINEVRMRTKSLGSVLRICLMLCYT